MSLWDDLNDPTFSDLVNTATIDPVSPVFVQEPVVTLDCTYCEHSSHDEEESCNEGVSVMRAAVSEPVPAVALEPLIPLMHLKSENGIRVRLGRAIFGFGMRITDVGYVMLLAGLRDEGRVR